MHHRFVPMRKFYIGEEVTAEILVYSDLSDFQLKKVRNFLHVFFIPFKFSCKMKKILI